MIKLINKKIVISVAIVLMLSISIFAATMQTANAAVVIRNPFTVYAYLSATPSPIGVNQLALITFRVDQPAMGAIANFGHFNGTSVTIYKPDNKTETKSNLGMDSTSSGWFQYTPTQVGTYYFQMHFPEHKYWINSTNTQTLWTYLADDSEMIPLVVQADAIQGYSDSPPLPTGYWQRPVYAENKGWNLIADSWLMRDYDQTSRSFAGTPAFAPYTSGPQSAHILWNKPIIPGGIAGGQLGDVDFYTGVSYEQHFDAMVVNGILFYTEHGLTGTSTYGTRFINLFTGEDYPLMYMNNTNFAFAQIINTNNPNEHGAIPYLVLTSTSSWLFYEILPNMQGEPRLAFNLSGMSGLTGTNIPGPQGEILSFATGGNTTHRYITMFNSSRAVLGIAPVSGGIETWSPSGAINASRRLNETPRGVSNAALAEAEANSHSKYMGIEWNVTFAKPATSTLNPSFRAMGSVNYQEGWILLTATDSNTIPYNYYDVGFNIGSLLKQRSSGGAYPATITPTFAANRTMIHDIHDRAGNNIGSNCYVRYDEGEEVWYCFSMATGEQKWATVPLNNAWQLFSRNYEIAYDKLFTTGFDGHVRAFSMADGSLLWDYFKGSSGFENAYGTYPEYAGFTVADYTVYTTADEHSSDGILWRGSQLWAINTDTGNLTFKVNGMYRHPIVADGIVVALNSYDGSVYAFGRGPSKTTVSAPQTILPLGNKVMITGTVTDQTPQWKDTPAIADANMGDWMEYMAMQKDFPADAKGVTVILTAKDPNGNTVPIGTTTSDNAGNFGIMYQPEITGTYQITAVFAGSESYGGSFGTAYLGVGPAEAAATPTPTLAPTPTPTEAPTATPVVTPSPYVEPEAPNNTALYVGVSAVVIIVAIAAIAVFLRRRK